MFNPVDIALLLVVALIFAGALIKWLRKRAGKSGACSCCPGCAGKKCTDTGSCPPHGGC